MRSPQFGAALPWLIGVCLTASLFCLALTAYLGPAITSGGQFWLSGASLLVLIPGLGVLGLSIAAVRLRLMANDFRHRSDRTESAARAANDECMRLLADMSQELRTPLTCILGQAELMTEEDGLNSTQMTRLARLSEAGRLMRNTVNRAMDVARVDDRVELFDFEPCDVASLVASCLGMVEAEARRKGLRLINTIDPATPPLMTLARDLVQQVMVNLAMNAVKFTDQGSVELRVVGDDTQFWFEVVDTGQGMPPPMRRKLFAEHDGAGIPDYRAGSIGLGLSITERFVHRMGGRIGSKENRQGGSTFWVELPTGRHEEPIAAAVTDAPPPPSVLLPCDLDQLVPACLGMVESETKRKGLELTSAFDPTTPHHVMLARDLVQQVLVYLLMNAVKFTAAGTVALRIKGTTERLRFEVADMGPGIPVAKRRALVRKYDRPGNPDHANTGPDLPWIIERFVSHMGGEIGFTDNPSGGTVFWVDLPTAAADAFIGPEVPTMATELAPMTANDGPPASAPELHHLRILLADDMDLTRLVAAEYLRSAGHTVTEVSDGEAAIAEVEKRDFDVVLTDMRMPIVDGMEVTRRIRALPGHRGRTPVVLVTANLIANDHVASGGSGVDLCVMKPFTRAELLAAVAIAARLMPVPPARSAGNSVLDQYVLTELKDILGTEGFSTQVDVTVRRIEDLLALLETPDADQNPAVHDAIHDLGGGVGLFGLTALSSSLRRFDIGHDDGTSAAALRDVAIQSVRALQEIREPAAVT